MATLSQGRTAAAQCGLFTYKSVPCIKTFTEKVGWARMDGIDLVQDSDRWRALVNAVMNLRVP